MIYLIPIIALLAGGYLGYCLAGTDARLQRWRAEEAEREADRLAQWNYDVEQDRDEWRRRAGLVECVGIGGRN